MYNDLKENWSYNEWPDVDLNGNIVKKKSLKESVGISPKRRRVVVDGQEEFDGSKFVKDLNEGACPDCGKEVCECGGSKLTEVQKGSVVTVYMHYNDQGLPDAQGETAQELADQLGVDKMTVLNRIARKDPKYARVTWDEEDPFFNEDLTPAEQKEKEDIEGPMGVVRSRDRERYSELRDLENDKSRKVCGDVVCDEAVNEDLLNAKVSPERGRVIVDGQTDFDGSKFVKDLNEAKKADKPENIKDCLIAALDEIEVPEDEELDPKKVLDAIADCLDDEAREYLCGILCPEEKEEEVAEEEPVEVEEEPAEGDEEEIDESKLKEDVAADLAAFEAGLN